MATGYNNKDRYSTVGKIRRSSPGDSHAHGAFFQTGQVPPNYSSTPYTQPRSTPKLDYNISPQVYGYPPTGASPQFPPTFPNNYEMYAHERHSPQPSYPAYPSRSMTPGMGAGGDRARLPPLAISSNPRGDQWPQQQAYLPQQSNYHGNAIRSPIATYPPTYSNYPLATQANPYGYHIQPGPHDHLSTMNPHGHHGLYDELRLEPPRSNSPYGHGSRSGSSHVSSHASTHVPPNRSYTPPPVTPTSPEEPTIKKKRKRADAAQLKVLNETYNRTAFPSTEERIALAKMLDMSARSVQIWFQNKRQSMRQTNRQSTSASASHHHYGMPSQVDPMAEDLVPHPQPGYDTGSGMGDPLYLTGPSQDASRGHGSHSHSHYHSSSSHRHGRESEVVDPRKWSRP